VIEDSLRGQYKMVFREIFTPRYHSISWWTSDWKIYELIAIWLIPIAKEETVVKDYFKSQIHTLHLSKWCEN
jgi:hypothetical protein